MKTQEKSGEVDVELSLMPGWDWDDEKERVSQPDMMRGHSALGLQADPHISSASGNMYMVREYLFPLALQFSKQANIIL